MLPSEDVDTSKEHAVRLPLAAAGHDRRVSISKLQLVDGYSDISKDRASVSACPFLVSLLALFHLPAITVEALAP